MKNTGRIKYFVLVTVFAYTVVFEHFYVNRLPLFFYEKQSVIALVAFTCIFFLMCMLRCSLSQNGWGIFLVLYCALFAFQSVFIYIPDVYVPLFLPGVIMAILYRPYCGMAFHLMYSISFFYISGGSDLSILIYWIIMGMVLCFVTDFMKDIPGMTDSAIIFILVYVILSVIKLRYESSDINYLSVVPGLIPVALTVAAGGIIIIFRKYMEVRKKSAKKKYIMYCNEDFKPIADMREFSLRIFYHSLEVADLSAAAAAAVNADAMLARAGAMYHDIGKSISGNYVKAGVLIAKEYDLPDEVINIIEEHNGKLRKPSTKESAIVFLADTLASTRDYMVKKGNVKLDEKKVIESVMALRLDSGMLDESGLTLSDFREIKKTFTDILCGGR